MITYIDCYYYVNLENTTSLLPLRYGTHMRHKQRTRRTKSQPTFLAHLAFVNRPAISVFLLTVPTML